MCPELVQFVTYVHIYMHAYTYVMHMLLCICAYAYAIMYIYVVTAKVLNCQETTEYYFQTILLVNRSCDTSIES